MKKEYKTKLFLILGVFFFSLFFFQLVFAEVYLSNQTSEIIPITNAELLNDSGGFIENVYKKVQEKDNIWVSLANGQYVRVIFDQILNNTKDNTIYVRPTNQSQLTTIEVYPVYTDKYGNITEGPLVTTFQNIDHEGWYKVLLTNLQKPTDTFDLKVLGNVELDYVVDPTCSQASGGTVTQSGGYCVHTFTTVGNSTFTTTVAMNIDALVVAGGGGGGGAWWGGGGGGGGVQSSTVAVTSQVYPITVGNGGPSRSDGGNSSFSNLIVANGGGKGGGPTTGSNDGGGGNGGSGGGGGWPWPVVGPTPGGTGNQGYNGGTGLQGSKGSAGGGGGAGGNGVNGTELVAGNGGNGLSSTIYDGSTRYYAGGGGGAAEDGTDTAGTGTHGGGNGGKGVSNGADGTPNTGGGGGGGAERNGIGGTGGSGIVIIRYPLDSTVPIVSANNSSSTWYTSQRTATVSVSDTGGSNLAEVRYYFGSNPMNTACTTGGRVTTDGASLDAPDNGTTLYLCARDGAGNTATWNGVYNWNDINRKYWVGSDSTNSVAKWSLSSGGSGGAGVPSALYTAVFNSGGISNATMDFDFSSKKLSLWSDYTGSISLNYGKTLNLGNSPILETPIIVSSGDSQVSTTTYPLTGIFLGGSFIFNKEVGTTNVTSIVITQKGSLSADANLANLKLYYKKEATCSSTFPSGTTLFNTNGASFVSNIATTTGSITIDSSESPSQVCIYAKYDITGSTPPDQSLMGQTVDLEILNPSADITVNSSTVEPITAIDISGATTLVIPSTAITSVPPIIAMISLKMSDQTKNPTVFYLQDGALWIKEGVNGTPGKLTSDKVEVTSLRFTTLTGFLTTLFGSLRIEMTVKAKNEGETQEYNVERTFTTTVKVRKR